MKNEKSALIVIDMQNGFLQPESSLCIKQAKQTIPACTKAIQIFRKKGLPVIFATRIYYEDGSNVELTRKAVWEQGGKPLSPTAPDNISCDMPKEFEECSTDYHIVKPRFSAFFHTELDLLLRRLQCERIYLAGTTTPNCIRTTCYDGISLDYQVVVLEDCCSSNTDDIQKANILDMQNIGAEIISVQNLEMQFK